MVVGSKRKLSNSLGRAAERGKRPRLGGEEGGGGGRGGDCGGEIGPGGREGMEEGGSGEMEGGGRVVGMLGSVDHLLLAAGIEVQLVPCNRKICMGRNCHDMLLFC